jgi:hypothetical protein
VVGPYKHSHYSRGCRKWRFCRSITGQQFSSCILVKYRYHEKTSRCFCLPLWGYRRDRMYVGTLPAVFYPYRRCTLRVGIAQLRDPALLSANHSEVAEQVWPAEALRDSVTHNKQSNHARSIRLTLTLSLWLHGQIYFVLQFFSH